MKLVVTGTAGVISRRIAFWSRKQSIQDCDEKRRQSSWWLGLPNAGNG